MSPELETLDQLLGGELPISSIRSLYPDETSFSRGIQGLLNSGDIQLVEPNGTEALRWTWPDILLQGAALTKFKLKLTPQGSRKIR